MILATGRELSGWEGLESVRTLWAPKGPPPGKRGGLGRERRRPGPEKNWPGGGGTRPVRWKGENGIWTLL